MRKVFLAFSAFLFLYLNNGVKAQDRLVKPINTNWQFVLANVQEPGDSLNQLAWKEVTIPHTWNNKDIQSGEKVHYGTAFYKRDLELESTNPGHQYFIRFQGVGQYAKLYINNQYVGEHLGSYSAFVFNITRFLKFDTVNSILVQVNNQLNKSYPKDNFLFGIYGGIYRPVFLIETEDVHVAMDDFASSGIYIKQKNVSKKSAQLNIVCNLKNETSQKQRVEISHKLLTRDGKIVIDTLEEVYLFPGGFHPFQSKLFVNKPHLWNGRKDPYLYRLQTTIYKEGTPVDEIITAVGIRYYSIDPEKGFILNGAPYRLYGVCRHQEWQDLGNALLPENHKKDMELIYEIGATSIRLAHYQQSDYIYSLADSMGILVWAEIPFVNGYLKGADGNAEQQLMELIKQNYNHPSIFVWGLHNEVVKNGKVVEPANLTRKLHAIAKSLDPDRYTVTVSNIWWVYNHPIHELADLQGFNQYTGWYGGKPSQLKNWINSYHKAKPDVRFCISEYGAGGNIAHQSNEIKFPIDPKSSFFPENYQTYYHEQTWAAIESSPFIWASYVWNIFDFAVPEWDRGGIKGRNHKGLITYDRKTKKDAFYWYKANWSEEKVLHINGKRNNITDSNYIDVLAFCNFGIPELFVDGKKIGKMKKVVNNVDYAFHNLKIEKGKHYLNVKCGKLEDGFEITVH